VIVVKNTILLPRKQEQIFFDGGDCIHTSFPVAITHGSYPKQPGSLLASAVKVVDADNWNTDFEALMGVDIGVYFQAFQYSAFFFMAMERYCCDTSERLCHHTAERRGKHGVC
jgi:hypothetical protein